MKHPDLPFVRKTLEQALKRRRWDEWALHTVEFQPFLSQYTISIKKTDGSVPPLAAFPLVSELFDEVEKDDSSFSIMRLRKKLKEKVPGLPDDLE